MCEKGNVLKNIRGRKMRRGVIMVKLRHFNWKIVCSKQADFQLG